MRAKGIKADPTPENNADIAEISEAATLSAAQQQVAEMQQPIRFVPNPLPPDALTILLLEKVPLVSGFLRSVDGTGVSLSKLAYIQGNLEAARVNSAFRLAAIAIAFIDFIRIPLIYLAAWLLGQKLPITLSQNAKWLYSAVILGLTIASILAPAAVCIFITLATASFALAVSIFTLAKHFYDRQQTKKELVQIGVKIVQAESDLHGIQQEAKDLARRLRGAENDEERTNCIRFVRELQGRLDAKKQEMQQLYDKQLEQTQILEALGWGSVLDKTVGLTLAAVSVIGIVLAFFIPPLGWGIFAASAIASGLYISAQWVYILSALKLAKPSEEVPSVCLITTETASRRHEHAPSEQYRLVNTTDTDHSQQLEPKPAGSHEGRSSPNSPEVNVVNEVGTSNLVSALLAFSALYRDSRHPERSGRHPESSEGSPECGIVLNQGDPSLRSG